MSKLIEVATSKQGAFYIGKPPYLYRAGEPAKIIGVHVVTPPGLSQRLCFEIEFADGDRNLAPVEDTDNYNICSSGDVEYSFKEIE